MLKYCLLLHFYHFMPQSMWYKITNCYQCYLISLCTEFTWEGATQIDWCTHAWTQVPKIPPNKFQLISKKQTNKQTNKHIQEFVLFHIRFDPLKMPDFLELAVFLNINVLRPIKCEMRIIHSTEKKKKTLSTCFFLYICVQYICVPLPPELGMVSRRVMRRWVMGELR